MILSGALFTSAIGPCGVAWGDAGIVGVQLPEGDRAATERRLRRRFPTVQLSQLPPAVLQATTAMARLLAGETVDLSSVVVDFGDASVFHQRVWTFARTIARGSTLTYGEVARALGEPGSARSIGQAMGLNPCPIIVPCHRVIAAAGKPGGFSASGGAVTKMRMLAIEGAPIAAQRTLF